MPNMKVNFNVPVKDFYGKESPNIVGKELATAMFIYTKPLNVKKFYDWAVNLMVGKELALDESDYNLLKEFLGQIESVPLLIKGQAQEILDKAKEESEKAPKK